MQTHIWLLLARDIERPVGGIKQIYRLAESISRLNVSVTVVQGPADFLPSWFVLSPLISRISYAEFKNTPLNPDHDVLVLPETFIPHFFSLPNIPKIIFNQNAGYTFGERLNILPSFAYKVYNDPGLVSILVVSDEDASFLVNAFGVDNRLIHRIFNPIEGEVFFPSLPKKRVISYMPRKNTSHSLILTKLLEQQPWFSRDGWTLLPIDKVSHADVSALLRESFIFLSFGCPEGFGLPLAESLSSGCHLIGYNGVGGREIFNLVQHLGTAIAVDYHDFNSFLHSVTYVANNFDYYSSASGQNVLLQSSRLTLRRYSQYSFDISVKDWLSSTFSSP